MELVKEAASAHDVIFCIMIVMGYAIAFSYLLIVLAKREMGYLRKDNERDLKYLQERFAMDIKWLREENSQLRKELRDSTPKN